MSKADLLAQLEAAAEASPLTLEQLGKLVNLSLEIETEMSEVEEKLKELKARRAHIDTRLLPDAMKAAGVSEFVAGNHKVTLAEELTCSVPKIRMGEIIEKLRSEEYGAGDLVRNTVTVELPPGQDAAAKKALAALTKLGLSPECAETVATPSVKALLARRRKAGKDDDLNFFGAYMVTKANIK